MLLISARHAPKLRKLECVTISAQKRALKRIRQKGWYALQNSLPRLLNLFFVAQANATQISPAQIFMFKPLWKRILPFCQPLGYERKGALKNPSGCLYSSVARVHEHPEKNNCGNKPFSFLIGIFRGPVYHMPAFQPEKSWGKLNRVRVPCSKFYKREISPIKYSP